MIRINKKSSSMSTQPKNCNVHCSVIVPVFNDDQKIGVCIESVLFGSFQEFELIIVDDGSTDNTRTVLKKYNYDPRVKVVSLDENVGPSHARNVGIRKSQGDILVFTDSDCIVTDRWLESFVKIAKVEKVSIGKCVSYDHRKWAMETHKQYSSWVKNNTQGTYSRVLDTKNCMISKDVFEDIGFFDENLRTSEDTDLAIRIQKAGYKIYYCQDANISHDDPKSFKAHCFWAIKRSASHRHVATKHNKKSPMHINHGKKIFYAIILGLFGSIAVVYGQSWGIGIMLAAVFVLMLAFSSVLKNFVKFAFGMQSWMSFLFQFARDIGFKIGFVQELLFRRVW